MRYPIAPLFVFSPVRSLKGKAWKGEENPVVFEVGFLRVYMLFGPKSKKAAIVLRITCIASPAFSPGTDGGSL